MRGPRPREGVVDIRIDVLSLAQDQGRGQGCCAGVKLINQLGPARCPQIPQPASPAPLAAARIETDSGGVIHHDSQADPLGSKVRAVIELAAIERPGDPRHLTRQLDRLTGEQIVAIAITRHDDQGST